MSDESFEWQESDSKYKEYESTNEVSFNSDVLYGFDCVECGAEVWNEDFTPDPDDPVWHYSCHECGTSHHLRPTKVSAYATTE